MLYEKTCCICKQVKPITEYHKNKGRKDGLSCVCKPCAIAISRKWRDARPDYYKPKLAERKLNPAPFVIRERRQYERNAKRINARIKLRREKYPEKFKEYGQRARIKDAVKIKARKILQYAVKKGRIIKSNICFDCQKTFPKKLIQSHHDDYSKPLEVKWLCKKCHSKRHRKYTDAMLGAVESGEMKKCP